MRLLPAQRRQALKHPVLRVTVKMAEGMLAGTGEHLVTFSPQSLKIDVVCRVPLSPFHPWSPESPALYHAELQLCDGDRPVHGWTERFGVRKIEVRGNRFFLNNKPFFVRGYGDDFVYPLTLVSPASREEHRRHLAIARRGDSTMSACTRTASCPNSLRRRMRWA